MFLTEEERRPLGGFALFFLPLVVSGGAAALCLSFASAGSGPSLWDHLTLAVGLSLVAFLFLYKPSVPGRSVLAAVLTGLFTTLSWQLTGHLAREAILPFALSAYAALSLAGGWVNHHADHRPGFLPAYRYVFVMALSLPVWGMILFLFSLLIGLMGVAVFGAAESWWQSREVTLSSVLLSAIAGGIAGGLLAVVRMQRVLLGTLRFSLLWLARFLLPVAVVVAFSLLLATGYPPPATAAGLGSASGILLLVWLNFQDGEGRRPALWLRGAVWLGVVLAAILVTPLIHTTFFPDGPGGETVSVLYLAALTGAASLVAFMAILSELNFASRRWMPAAAPLISLLLVLVAFGPLILGAALRIFPALSFPA